MPSTVNVESQVPHTIAAHGKPRRWLSRTVWLATIGCSLLLLCFIFRSPLLTGVAEAWVVNDPTTKADAIVILGGGLENRPFAAAKLYRDGVAPRVLYMNVKLSPAEEIGVTSSEGDVTRRILLNQGVPDTAMTMIGNGVASTYDESLAVRVWLATNAAKSILIATDLSHTHRARWIFRKELKGTDVDVFVHAIQPKEYGSTNWWLHEQGLIAFQNEFVKSAYYWVKY